MELSDSTDFRRDYYRENGFVKLDKVFTADEIHGLERDVTDAVMQLHDPNVDKPPNSDSDAYEQAFTPWHCAISIAGRTVAPSIWVANAMT